MFKHYVKRTIKKIFAIPLWFIFSIINLIATPLSALMRFVAFPGTILAVIYATTNFYKDGFSPATIRALLFGFALATAYSFAPNFNAFVRRAKYSLKRAALRPIVVRPPVRFTA